MGLFENIGGAITTASKKAAKAYDYKRLELKIRAYEKELDQLYRKVGRISYVEWSTGVAADREKLVDCMENLKNIHFRINQLSKNISEMKKEDSSANKASAENPDLTNYAKLSKKENDLKISRTSEGIKMLRYCKSCQTPNSPKAEVCENCGTALK